MSLLLAKIDVCQSGNAKKSNNRCCGFLALPDPVADLMPIISPLFLIYVASPPVCAFSVQASRK
jgi:hypothetical protein